MNGRTADAPGDLCFADLVRRRGIVPNFRQAHGSGSIELVDLLDATAQTGDRILCLARSGRIDHRWAHEILERLLGCYSDPLTKAREVAQITRDVGKLEP